MIAPAAFRRATDCASRAGTNSARIIEPLVVRSPAVSVVSVIVSGTPCNGPDTSPRVTAASAFLACSIRSGAIVTMALSEGLSCSMRSRCACTISTGDNSRERIFVASVAADSLTKSDIGCGEFQYCASEMRSEDSQRGNPWIFLSFSIQRTEGAPRHLVPPSARRSIVFVLSRRFTSGYLRYAAPRLILRCVAPWLIYETTLPRRTRVLLFRTQSL